MRKMYFTDVTQNSWPVVPNPDPELEIKTSEKVLIPSPHHS